MNIICSVRKEKSKNSTQSTPEPSLNIETMWNNNRSSSNHAPQRRSSSANSRTDDAAARPRFHPAAMRMLQQSVGGAQRHNQNLQPPRTGSYRNQNQNPALQQNQMQFQQLQQTQGAGHQRYNQNSQPALPVSYHNQNSILPRQNQTMEIQQLQQMPEAAYHEARDQRQRQHQLDMQLEESRRQDIEMAKRMQMLMQMERGMQHRVTMEGPSGMSSAGIQQQQFGQYPMGQTWCQPVHGIANAKRNSIHSQKMSSHEGYLDRSRPEASVVNESDFKMRSQSLEENNSSVISSSVDNKKRKHSDSVDASEGSTTKVATETSKKRSPNPPEKKSSLSKIAKAADKLGSSAANTNDNDNAAKATNSEAKAENPAPSKSNESLLEEKQPADPNPSLPIQSSDAKTDNTPSRSKRIRRPTVTFVARPSKQGVSVEEGDILAVAGAVSKRFSLKKNGPSKKNGPLKKSVRGGNAGNSRKTHGSKGNPAISDELKDRENESGSTDTAAEPAAAPSDTFEMTKPNNKDDGAAAPIDTTVSVILEEPKSEKIGFNDVEASAERDPKEEEKKSDSDDAEGNSPNKGKLYRDSSVENLEIVPNSTTVEMQAPITNDTRHDVEQSKMSVLQSADCMDSMPKQSGEPSNTLEILDTTKQGIAVAGSREPFEVINLVPPENDTSIISAYHNLLVSNIEFFYPSSDAPTKTMGESEQKDNRLGFRCIHCKKYYVEFPDGIASEIETFGARHLCKWI